MAIVLTAAIAEVQTRIDALTGASTLDDVLDAAIAAKKMEAGGGTLDRTILDTELNARIAAMGGSTLIEDLILAAATVQPETEASAPLPIIPTKDLGAAGFPFMADTNRIAGFVGDGDYILLPTGLTASIDYFDENMISQPGWPISIADVAAVASGNIQRWVNFGFYGSNLMVACLDASPTPAQVTFINIDVGGNISAVGNTVSMGADFPTDPGWLNTLNAGGNCLHRLNDAGNMFLIVNAPEACWQAEFSAADGSVVSAPAKIIDCDLNLGAPYKTANGLYAGNLGANSTFNDVEFRFGAIGKGSAIMKFPNVTAITTFQGVGGVYMQTHGYRTLVRPNGATQGGRGRFYDAAALDTGLEALGKMGSVTP